MQNRTVRASQDVRTAATRLFVAALLLLSVAGFAQTTAGRILGTLTDQSGAAVSGAIVQSQTRSVEHLAQRLRTTRETSRSPICSRAHTGFASKPRASRSLSVLQ